MWMCEYVHIFELQSTCMDNFFCVSCQCRQGEEVISQGRVSSLSIYHSLFDLLQLLDPRRSTASIVQILWRAPAGPKPSWGHKMCLDLSHRRSDYPGEWKALKSPDDSRAARAWLYFPQCLKRAQRCWMIQWSLVTEADEYFVYTGHEQSKT